MDERGSVLGGGRGEYGSQVGWGVLAGGVAVVVWVVFGPLGSLWLYVLGWAAALAAVDGVFRLVRPQGLAVPPPGRLVAGLLRLGPESWLVAPRWAKVRLAAGGFLVFSTIAGVMGWQAAQEYQVLAGLRAQGLRTDAIVVEITGRSEEGWVTSVTVRFSTPSGSVRADVDVPSGSADAAKPGAYIPLAYNPAHPTEARDVAYLDGREADGARQGAIVIGSVAAGFLVGTAMEVFRVRRRTGEVQDTGAGVAE
ncbi:DUF3592 domain-containing protein [Streptomyces sp. NPDC005706]|uniref:DUF3592 domain-containing protein n=1 Tax=Streptomyces sp. NPDC005706 TaxID=3157169 RepID=UPI0033C7426C